MSRNKVDIKTSEQIPNEFHDCCIHRGYRSVNASYKAYVRSLFELNNNEMINFWTHFIPFLCVLAYIVQFEEKHDAFNYSFMIYLSSLSLCFFTSSIAHAFHSRSKVARHVFFILDYIAISAYGIGSCIALKAYSLSVMPEYTATYLSYHVTIGIVITTTMNAITSGARFIISPQLRAALKMISVLLPQIFNTMPILLRLFIYSEQLREADYYFIATYISGVICVVVYALRIPERFAPGRFDIIGQSHQWYHICTVITAYIQFKAIRMDMKQVRTSMNNNQSSLYSSLNYTEFIQTTNIPYLEATVSYFHAIIAFFIANALIVFYYYIKATHFNPWDSLVYAIEGNCCSSSDNENVYGKVSRNVPVITSILCLVSGLVYLATIDSSIHDASYNSKRAILFCALFFLLFGSIITPDGPFKRPHPIFWRLIMSVNILYQVFLVYILAHNVDESRQLLKHVDSSLGVPLVEKSYASNCRVYDPQNSTSPWHNIVDKLDIFVLSHFSGWIFGGLFLRDFWVCTFVSVVFEMYEYTLQHQLPNLQECWWDHWILDALICNTSGIYIGIQLSLYFSLEPYNWCGVESPKVNITNPKNWIRFLIKPRISFKRLVAIACMVTTFSIFKLTIFYLKWVLWIPTDNMLTFGRIVLPWLSCAVGIREVFDYLDDQKFKRLGPQVCLFLMTIFTEILVIIKFAANTISKPLSSEIKTFWMVFILVIIAWTIWHYLIVPSQTKRRKEKAN